MTMHDASPSSLEDDVVNQIKQNIMELSKCLQILQNAKSNYTNEQIETFHKILSDESELNRLIA